MKLKTEELRERVEVALDRAAQLDRDAKTTREEERAAQVDQWREQCAPVLAARLRALATKAKRGSVVTGEDLTRAARDGDGSSLTFYLRHRTQPKTPSPGQVEELKALRSFLGTVHDETVSTSALSAAGFRNLASVLRV